MKQLNQCSIMELITLLNNKQISSLDIINSLFSIIDKKDDLIGAYLTLDREEIVKNALDADKKRSNG